MKSPAVRLPLLFDTAGLQADLAAIAPDAWVRHYRGDHYEGAWSVVPLRSVAGHPAVIHAAPGGDDPVFYKDTPWLERSPCFRDVIERLHCRVNAVRLMKLAAGARILEHTDDMGEGDCGELRLHLVVQTNPGVQFWVGGEVVPMREGELWFADFNLPHRVENNGDTDRIHLVLDCTPNDWLKGLVSITNRHTTSSPSTAAGNQPGPGREGVDRMGVENAKEGLTLRVCALSATPSGKDELIQKLNAWVQGIGVLVCTKSIVGETFLPGVTLENGTLVVDPTQLKWPGDILHEAGHIALAAPSRRAALGGMLEVSPGEEMAALAWSYAAAVAAGVDPAIVFHEGGYKSQGPQLREAFACGAGPGVPMLQWYRMTRSFPHMEKWIRDCEDPTA